MADKLPNSSTQRNSYYDPARNTRWGREETPGPAPGPEVRDTLKVHHETSAATHRLHSGSGSHGLQRQSNAAHSYHPLGFGSHGSQDQSDTTHSIGDQPASGTHAPFGASPTTYGGLPPMTGAYAHRIPPNAMRWPGNPTATISHASSAHDGVQPTGYLTAPGSHAPPATHGTSNSMTTSHRQPTTTNRTTVNSRPAGTGPYPNSQSGEKFTCGERGCSKEYTRWGDLYNHERDKHNMRANDEIEKLRKQQGKKTLTCKHCGKGISGHAGLEKHIRLRHSEVATTRRTTTANSEQARKENPIPEGAAQESVDEGETGKVRCQHCQNWVSVQNMGDHLAESPWCLRIRATQGETGRELQ